jgi:hypothetical protein
LSSLGPPVFAFAIPEAGFDYFATQTHYRLLASRILTTLGGFNVVVVLTGDRSARGPMIGTALGEAAAGRYTVIGFQCEPEQGRQDAMRFCTALPASLPRGSAADRDSDIPALLVFDRKSPIQVRMVTAAGGDPGDGDQADGAPARRPRTRRSPAQLGGKAR